MVKKMSIRKKLLTVVLVILLAFNMFYIGASALVEGSDLVAIDVNLEVGRTSGGVFTPLTPGEALHTNDIITVRCAPTTNFFTGASKIVVMFTTAYFEIQGVAKAAFTVNSANSFYSTSCSDYAGTTAQIPSASWPASMRTVVTCLVGL